MEINNEGSITPPLNSQFKKRAAFDIDRIHPDDAKDKVFIGIIKALIKMDNKPSSPKELAGFIIKHKLAVLGGATPYATVSSRISQHFKRATEHKPPRKPLLAKSFDLKHTRKIRYCLDLKESNGDESEGSQSSPTSKTQDSTPKTATAKKSPVPPSSSSARSKSINRDSSPLEDSSLDVIDVESEDEVVEVSTTKEIIPDKKSPVFVKSAVKRNIAPPHPPPQKASKPPSPKKPPVPTPPVAKPQPKPADPVIPIRTPLSTNNPFVYNFLNSQKLKVSSNSKSTLKFSSPYKSKPTSPKPYIASASLINSVNGFNGVVIEPTPPPISLPTPTPIPVSMNIRTPSPATIQLQASIQTSTPALAHTPIPTQAPISTPTPASAPIPVPVPASVNPVKIESIRSPRLTRQPQSIASTSVNTLATEEAKKALSPPTALSPYINLRAPASLNNFLQDTLSPRTSALFDHDLRTIPDISFKMGATNTHSIATTQGTSSFLLPQFNDPVKVPTSELDQLFETGTFPPPPPNSLNGFGNKHISSRPPHPLSKDTTTTSPSKSKLKTISTSLTSSSKSPLFAAIAASKKPLNSSELDASQALLHLPISPQFNAFDSSSNPKPPSNTPDRKSSPPPYFSIDDFLASPSLTGFKGVMDVDYSHLLPVPEENEYNSFDLVIPGESWSSFGIYITLADNLPIYAARFTRTSRPAAVKTEENGMDSNFPNLSDSHDVLLTRWIDSDYVNASTLLEAGGVTTKEEQSIILSLEQSCIQINKTESPLHGTWIPLHRARALAMTCNLNQKLGAFLDQDLDKLFPKPLPLDPTKLPASCIPSLILKGCLDATKCPKIPYHYSAHLRFRPIPLVQLPPNILEQEMLIVNNRDREVGGVDLSQPLFDPVDSVESLNPRKIGLSTGRDIDFAPPPTSIQSTYQPPREEYTARVKAEYIEEDEDEEINIDEDEDVDIGGSDMEDDLR